MGASGYFLWCFLFVYRLLRFAQMPGCAPGGAGTFLGRQEKSPKEGGPADCVPTLRSGQPVVRGRGVCGGTRYTLRIPL